jgi:hypothetical protein
LGDGALARSQHRIGHQDQDAVPVSRITVSDGLVIAAFDGLPSSGSRLP